MKDPCESTTAVRLHAARPEQLAEGGLVRLITGRLYIVLVALSIGASTEPWFIIWFVDTSEIRMTSCNG